MSDVKITAQQRNFVFEYLVDLNATQAAIRAGYTKKNAEQMGYQLLQKPSVQASVAVHMKAREARTEITQDRVLQELAKLAFTNMMDYMTPSLVDGTPVLDFSKLTRDQAAALTEITVEEFMDGKGPAAEKVRRVKFKLADKRAALTDIGKHLGMFIERAEVKMIQEKASDLELDAAIAMQEKIMKEAGIALH